LNPIPYSAHLIAAEAGLRKILRENILFMPGRIHPAKTEGNAKVRKAYARGKKNSDRDFA